jgi:hypothetical protein
MAKKSRRARRRRAPRDVTQISVASAAREEVPAAGVTRPANAVASGFAEQYAYVYGDLKRIAVLAVTLLAVLFALSFVIR